MEAELEVVPPVRPGGVVGEHEGIGGAALRHELVHGIRIQHPGQQVRSEILGTQEVSVSQVEAGTHFVGKGGRGVHRQEVATRFAWVGLVTLGISE